MKKLVIILSFLSTKSFSQVIHFETKITAEYGQTDMPSIGVERSVHIINLALL